MPAIPTSIYRLNRDILRMIFVEVDAMNQPPCGMPVVSAVSHEWRALAFGTPAVWQNICACALVPYERRMMQFEVSRDIGLNVSFSVHSAGLMDALAIASRHIERMRSFSVTIREDDIEEHETDVTEAAFNYFAIIERVAALSSSGLVRLTLVWDVGGIDDDWAPTFHTSMFNAPNLRWLELDGFVLFCDRISVFAFRNLAVLSLNNLRRPYQDGMHELVAFLRHCPALRCLLLDRALAWSPTLQPMTEYNRSIRSVIIRDDVGKIATFLGFITFATVDNLRIWALSSHTRHGIHVGRSTVSIMRSQLMSTILPLKNVTRVGISYSDSDHYSVGWSTSGRTSGSLWDGLSSENIRPSSLIAERDAIQRTNTGYEVVMHVVADHAPHLSCNAGILNAEHVIRHFVIYHQRLRVLDTFCARGISFAVAEYVHGVQATNIVIDQANTPLQDWLVTIGSNTLSKTTTIHICRSFLSDDAVVALHNLRRSHEVKCSGCVQNIVDVDKIFE